MLYDFALQKTMRRITPFIVCIVSNSLFAQNNVEFSRDIRPILSRNCFACHGPDAEARQADLRLDTLQGATADLGDQRAVAPGYPDDSSLIARIESNDPDLLMPPPDSGHRLTDEEKRTLRQWIVGGASYGIHWSFTPPTKAAPPATTSDWPQHPLDHFVLASLEAKGLQPTIAADRYQWIRRVSLDLTGLPPTPAEADAFVADTGAQAFATVVDRLLDSRAYGEHWARMWLDLARYADTKGYEKDRPREIWRYRDWVINAFNADMPFDQFTREQLAGDLLPSPSTEQYVATAFHRNTMTNEEGGTDDEEFRVAAVKDRVDTTMQVWMGLTMGCAKCHSHKFDPISMQDYYSFFALFNQTQDSDRGDEFPTIATPTPEQSRKLACQEAAVGETQRALTSASKRHEFAATFYYLAKLKGEKKLLDELRKSIVKTPVMRELASDKQRTTRIHQRGNFLDQGAAVQPRVPTLLGPFPEDAPTNRLGVAQWLTQPDNPLTARVMVNRIWARLFGVGIVETEEDFGSQGSPPLHPDLLDWLAVDFRESGWSMKQLLRSIVLSSTYRQSATVTETQLAADPRNRLFSRGPRFRLSAEMVRDQALAVSGLLTRKLGGPSVMPPQPTGIWRSTYSGLKWQNASGPDRYRRGLYTYWKRTSPYPAMLTFDAGSGEVCQIRRVRTNTPLQALVTLNDPAFVEAAGALSERMANKDGDLHERLTRGFRLVLTRPPTDRELARLASLYQALQIEFADDRTSAEALVAAAGIQSGDAAMIAVANVLLNLDETLMKP